MDRATNTILEALVLFYPRAAAGNALAKKLPEMLAKMDRELAEESTKRLNGLLSNMPTDSPGLSESVHVPTRSDS